LSVDGTATFLLPAEVPTQLKLLLIEDGLVGTGLGWDQLNAYDTEDGHPFFEAGNPIIGFEHANVLRATPVGLQDDGAVAGGAIIGQVEAENWQVQLPALWDENNLSIALMLTRDTDEILGRRVLNITQVPLPKDPDVSLSGTAGTADEPELTFPTVHLGESSEATITIHSTGTTALEIGAPNEFLGDSVSILTNECLNISLAPDDDCNITLLFEPTTLGDMTDLLIIPAESRNDDNIEVALFGTALSGPAFTLSGTTGSVGDPVLDFGPVSVDEFSDLTVTATSTGDQELSLGTVEPLPAPFSIIADGCSDLVHEQGDTCGITLRFAPTEPASAFSTVQIPWTTGSGDLSFVVTGTGDTGGCGCQTSPTSPPVAGLGLLLLLGLRRSRAGIKATDS
jgi:MYXO-CTERM domain-containing protein